MQCMRVCIAFTVCASLLHWSSASFSFLTIGDWGGAAISEYTHNVYNVADQMVKTATQNSPAFIINTGDSFYWCGIQNTSDYQVDVDWVQPYDDPALEVPWYSVLGNHEYGYNVDAQIELGQVYSKWIMDSRYYTRRVQLDSTNYLSLVFLDTSPCVSSYRSSDMSGWDPCSTKYPTCSLDSTDDDFEGECMFHSNIMSQNCTEQYDWLSQALESVPTDDWLIVVGHHPIDEANVNDLTTLVQKRGFALYLNGHTHSLVQYTIDNAGIYITSGAGGLVSTPDQESPVTAAKLRGEDLHVLNNATGSHSYHTVFSSVTAGFTQHIFNDAFTALTTNFVSYDGRILRTITTDKTGQYV